MFDKPVAITLTQPSGKVITNPHGQPKPGDVLDVYSVDYVGNHRHHQRPWTMSAHARCVFGIGQPNCKSQIATGSSLIIFHGNKIVAGTGKYLRASGRILSTKEVPGIPNATDIVARIHRH